MDNALIISLAAGAAALVALVLAIVAFLKQKRYEKRLAAFFAGKDAASLEDIFAEKVKMLDEHSEAIDEIGKAAEYLHRSLQATLRKVAFERYNPFPGVGGNQSFTLVLLDSFNSGVVISSLHNRESTRVYAKAVRQGSPLQTLSEEEDRVLKNALLIKSI